MHWGLTERLKKKNKTKTLSCLGKEVRKRMTENNIINAAEKGELCPFGVCYRACSGNRRCQMCTYAFGQTELNIRGQKKNDERYYKKELYKIITGKLHLNFDPISIPTCNKSKNCKMPLDGFWCQRCEQIRE